MAGRNFLFVPGPTNVPDRILRSMMVAMEDHRSSAFPELARGLFPQLRQLFRCTEGEVFLFPATGTGAWEASLANTLSPGDRVLAPRFGQFSHLWIDMMQRLGLDVEVIDVEWGMGAPEEAIAAALKADRAHRIKGVMVVHNETATGVTSDVGAVRRAMDDAGHPALLYVDAVSSLGSIDFRFSEWRVDLAVTGSQKGLMMPAGLGIVCASPRVLEAEKSACRASSSASPTCAAATWTATSRTRRRCRSSTACASRSRCCSRRACPTCSRATRASLRACARR